MEHRSMSILRVCADWRVVAALVAVGAGVALFAPNLVSAAIPLLIVAACPLSMILMMRTMGDHQSKPNMDMDGFGDRRSHVEDRLAVMQLERLQLERELARLDDGDRVAPAEMRRRAPAADVRARSS